MLASLNDRNAHQPDRTSNRCVRPKFGHCRHWGGLGFTSAMWWIADGGGVELPHGGFLHQRTHTPDLEATFDFRVSGHSKWCIIDSLSTIPENFNLVVA